MTTTTTTTKRTRKLVRRARELLEQLDHLADELEPRPEVDHLHHYVDNVRGTFLRCLLTDPEARAQRADR